MYAFTFLQTEFAQNQMLRNEYGAIQQHLEPEHIRNLLVPMPDDKADLERIVQSTRLAIQRREKLESQNKKSLNEMNDFISEGIEAANLNS